jgi:hypothetical protein
LGEMGRRAKEEAREGNEEALVSMGGKGVNGPSVSQSCGGGGGVSGMVHLESCSGGEYTGSGVGAAAITWCLLTGIWTLPREHWRPAVGS